MKKLIYTLTFVCLFIFSANPSIAAPAKEKKPLTEQQSLEVKRIQSRVEEIRAMDKSQLTREQRKELKNELKAMKQQARALTGGGVYLSVGAILIIILVLILVL